MKKLLLLLMLFIVSPRICINIEANNAIVSICNVIKKGMRFLFIGDSITDGGWGRSGGSMMPTEQNAFYWIWDGIHPTAAGHQKMADLWLSKIK